MTPAIGTLDPTYLAILVIGLAGVVVFVMETLVIEFHSDALAFLVAFGLLLSGVGVLAFDPELASATSRYLYHGVGIAFTGLVMFGMGYARRRIFLRTGAEGEDVSLVGEVEGGSE